MRRASCSDFLATVGLVVLATLAGGEPVPAQHLSGPGVTVRLSIVQADWQAATATLALVGSAPAGSTVVLSNAVLGGTLGAATADPRGAWVLNVAGPQPVPCRVRATSGPSTRAFVEKAVKDAPEDCDRRVAALSTLAVTGPSEVEERSTAAFVATATFRDGSSVVVTTQARWSEDSPYASISRGELTTSEVTANQTISVTAEFKAGAITRSASLTVTILDTSGPPVSGSHAGRFASYVGPATCIACHENEARAMHGSVHYQWLGDASEAVGLSTQSAGKLGGINDFCIYPDINWLGKLTNTAGVQVDGGCARCHTGLGAKPAAEQTQAQLENIDCLLCHAPSYQRTVALVDGQWRLVPDTAKMTVSLLQAAVDIHLPDKNTCLSCHTKAGGGNNYKRGDLEEAHRSATAAFDVHLAPPSAGGAGLECTSCHTASGHRIAGRGVDLRERDTPEPVACSTCHGSSPHGSSDLNRHTARVSCTVCHIPTFANVAATDMRRDWSLPGEVDPVTMLYEPHMLKASHVQPEYRFWNGRSEFYQFGDRAVPKANGRVLMAGPLGSINEPGAKIHAMKRHTGRQPQDPITERLMPLKIGVFFSTGNVDEAVRQGAAALGWTYAGHQFAETERYMGLFHEVQPHDNALSCTSCHGGSRLDFAALGYTPNATRNGKPLCESCHSRKSNPGFLPLHDKHVKDKKLDCLNCHAFSKAN